MSSRSRKAQVWIGVPSRKGAPPRVLLFKVIDRRGGGWHPVTGGVDPEESFPEGAKREVREETGLSASAGQWVDLDFAHVFEGRFGRAEERAFGLILPEAADPVLDSHEHTGFEWVSIEEALSRVGFEGQRDALRRFSCYLSAP